MEWAAQLISAKEYVCTNCGKREAFTPTASAFGYAKYDTCRVCGNLFCSDCLKTSSIPIFQDMWNPKNISSRPSNGKSLVCSVCHAGLMRRAMDEFLFAVSTEFDEHVEAFLNGNTLDWPRPDSSPDSSNRRAIRALRLADMLVDLTYLGPLTTRAVHIAAFGTQILSFIVPEDIYVILAPLMEGLSAFGVRGPTGAAKVYYLGCYHERERKMNPSTEYAHRNEGDVGLVATSCSEELLDLVGRYTGVAQWMYCAVLPEPHISNDWSAWFLSRVIGVDGWTLLACVNETSRLPDGKNCPSFALAVRDQPSKEVVLSIRGSASTGCWAINAKYKCADFFFRRKDGRKGVSGKAHLGMLDAATAILYDYKMDKHILHLATLGYAIRVVGHSMGGGTASLIAAELQNKCFDLVDNKILTEVPPLLAISFGAPPCVSADLSAAFLEDELVYTVVNQDDFVPRLCRHTLQKMADQLKEVDKLTDEWKDRDTASIRAYAASMGQAGATTSDLKIEEEKAEAVVEESILMKVMEAEEDGTQTDILVVAGAIIDIFKKNGQFESCVLNHKHRSLSNLHLIPSKGGHEHNMSSYADAIRGTKAAVLFKQSLGKPIQDSPVEVKLFNILRCC